MAWTKATYLSRTREWMDATGSDRWSDAFLYALLGFAFREEWKGLLDASPYYRFAQRSVTTDSDGQFTLASLDSGSGDSEQNLNKILTVTDGNAVVYRETEFMAVPLGTVGTANALEYDRRYYLRGDSVQMLPTTGGLALTVTVNYFPTPIDDLSGDSIEADFPAGYENVVALCAASDALLKGGAEAGATNDLQQLAQKYRQALYADVARRTATPTLLSFSDRAAEWGA